MKINSCMLFNQYLFIYIYNVASPHFHISQRCGTSARREISRFWREKNQTARSVNGDRVKPTNTIASRCYYYYCYLRMWNMELMADLMWILALPLPDALLVDLTYQPTCGDHLPSPSACGILAYFQSEFKYLRMIRNHFKNLT